MMYVYLESKLFYTSPDVAISSNYELSNFHQFSFFKPAENGSADGLEADVVVIGSSAGEGIMAVRLAAGLKGRTVIVIKMGEFVPPTEFPLSQRQTSKVCDGRGFIGAFVSEDEKGLILGGKTCGGGGGSTLLNFSGSWAGS